MLHYKLQFGCMILVIVVAALYFRERRKENKVKRVKRFEQLLMHSMIYFVLDMVTVYTVNHLDRVPVVLNNVLHLLYLWVIDRCLLDVFLYVVTLLEMPITSNKWKRIVFLPHYLGLLVMALGIPYVEYWEGTYSNYAMGLSVIVCYVLVVYYLTLAYYAWKNCKENVPKKARLGFLHAVPVFLGAIAVQMLIPEILITSLAITVIILVAYCSMENAANIAMMEYHDEVIYAFADVIEGRDGSTGEHVKRTVAYVRIIAEALKEQGRYSDALDSKYMEHMLKAAPMHDFGKIAVTDMVLQKPGRLTPEEYEIMKQHTVKGADMIKESLSALEEPDYIQVACQVARYHHERWDGKGYPEGLDGELIPLCARVMAVADVFDAVSQNRCYRDAMTLDQSFGIIEAGAGSQFDPLVADVFLQMREKVEAVFYQFQEGNN
ncbi:MAG: HD domain-containing protein [Lachnospiraceae bacterium]|nr:HD domain-containing protein [Lachnospiraceae bacterium]